MSATSILTTLPVAADGNFDIPTDELDRALQNLEVKQRKPRKTKQKDPDAPKRPASAYMLWLNENRAAIKDELLSTNPDAKITDVTKRAGEIWKTLTEDEKASFQTASEELRAKYHDAMKVYKPNHTVAKKSTAVKYDAEETPDAPEGWSGPFAMKYLYRKVKDVDGKHVRIQKNFAAAVELANKILADWNKAKQDESMPDHWKSDVQPCAGITKTSTGYDLRLGPDLMTTAEKDAKGGIASWLLGEHTADADTTTPEPELAPAPKPVKKNNNKHKTLTKTLPAPLEELKVDADGTVSAIELETLLGNKLTVGAQAVSDELAKITTATAGHGADVRVTTDIATTLVKNLQPKKKKVVKKVVKKKSPEPKAVDAEECQEIELERDGEEVTYLLHEETGMVYNPDNLVNAIGKADDEGIEFF